MGPAGRGRVSACIALGSLYYSGTVFCAQTGPEQGEPQAEFAAPGEAEVRRLIRASAPLEKMIALRDSQEGIRRRPSTERGEKTFNAILDSAQEVLAEEGLRSITTRKVSDRAEVNIATLYQYFVDIEAILMELSLRLQIATTSSLEEAAVELALGRDFEEWLADVVDTLAEAWMETESITALIYATRSLPYLRNVVNLGWEAGARLLATALSIRYPGLNADQWLVYTRATNSVIRFTLDDTISAEPFDRERLDLVRQMTSDFLVRQMALNP